MGQSEPASMTAPVGCSAHRMGCVFHLPLHPTLTNILPQSIFLPADLWSVFFGANFLATLTLPPSYPINLPTLLTYLFAYTLNPTTSQPIPYLPFLFLLVKLIFFLG